MYVNKSNEQSNSLADQAAQSADQAIKSTQRVTHEAFDSLSGSVQDVRHQVEPLLNRAGERVSAMVHRGADSVRETSQQLRHKVQDASDNTVSYIKQEPVKSMLIAAATGAALMALINLISHSRRRD